MLEKSASISSSGEFEYLLRSSFSSNELTLCSLWWAGFMRTWSLPRPPQQHPLQGLGADRWRGVGTDAARPVQ